MDFLIASDLHGSKEASEKLVSLDKKCNFEKIILLGDIGYSGARNIPPKDYSPLEVYENLAIIKEKLIVVRGNCDSRVDEMVLGIKFEDITRLSVGKYNLIFTHGDLFNEDNVPLKENDILFYGHTHVYILKEVDGYYVINPGSITLPKYNKEKTYIIVNFDDQIISLYSIEDKLIAQLKLN